MNYTDYVARIKNEVTSLAEGRNLFCQERPNDDEPAVVLMICENSHELSVTIDWDQESFEVEEVTVAYGIWHNHYNPYGEEPDFIAETLQIPTCLSCLRHSPLKFKE